MLRDTTLSEISDGKLYTANDMVKAGCNDCKGCSECCHIMEDTLILDPYDIYMLTTNLQTGFMNLLQEGKIALGVVDGVILPHINMGEAPKDGGLPKGCGFLDENERCSIHSFRPGFCRLFPLGRYYENGDFKYILQTNECKKVNRTKVKVKSFLGIENLKQYEDFVRDWHYYLRDVQMEVIESLEKEDGKANEIAKSILDKYFIKGYTAADFYTQYYERRKG